MPRRFRVFQKKSYPDPVYQNETIGMLINKIMLGGKKHIASNIVYDALNSASEKINKPPLEVFDMVMENVTPLVEVRSKRIGGAAYQIPTEIRPQRRTSLALRWIVSYSRQRKGMPMSEKLAAELIDAFNNTGGAVKKKETTHKMAEANKALAHFGR